jgi:hypothetical protein
VGDIYCCSHGNHLPRAATELQLFPSRFDELLSGLYGFGVAVADPYKYGWIWPAFFYALQIVSMVIATMVGSVYIVDGYGKFRTTDSHKFM